MPYAIGRFVRFAVNVSGYLSQGSPEKLAAAGIAMRENFIIQAGLSTNMRDLGVKDEAELKK